MNGNGRKASNVMGMRQTKYIAALRNNRYRPTSLSPCESESVGRRHYRLGMIQVLLISALGFAFATSTERGDDVVLAMLGRGCPAIRDLQTLELIR